MSYEEKNMTDSMAARPIGGLMAACFAAETPGGHGLHIHEKGDCSAPDVVSAGGHLNPTGKPHGSPDAPDHHAGGVADIVGKAVIVHEDADDYKTQPAGNSGARVACGVIAKS